MNDEKSEDNLEPTSNQVEPDPRPVEWFRKNSIPITGVVVLLLIFSVASRWGGPVGWTKAKDITDVWLNLAQFLALCLGGWWFCFKFIKGRAYRETLVMQVSGQVVKRGAANYLIVIAQLKNVGQSVIEFVPSTSIVQVFSYIDEQSDDNVPIAIRQLVQFVAFEDLNLEPGQTIERSSLIRIHGDVGFALRIELEVFDSRPNSCGWRASKIILGTPENDIIEQQKYGDKQ